jgi:hypothetical protein
MLSCSAQDRKLPWRATAAKIVIWRIVIIVDGLTDEPKSNDSRG